MRLIVKLFLLEVYILKMVRRALIFKFFILLCLYGRTATGTLLNNPFEDPDVNRNVSELIRSKGYTLEEHTILTADGYLLSVQRIPYGQGGNIRRTQNKAVLLIHGILADSNSFVFNFPGQSLGFVLPDAGYDTWLLNTRGNTYSRKHVEYTTNQYEFWNFSFEEVGKFDIPATIDYILQVTGEDALYVIGHSQGTTATFIMLSELSDYNKKVKLFIALAPVAKVGYITSIARLLSYVPDEVYFAMDLITSGEFSPNSKILSLFRVKTCEYIPELCADVLFLIAGADRQQLNKTRLAVYSEHFPASTSTKSALHYKQLVKSKKFRKYDYGRNNMKYYNQEEPPDYDVYSITAPVALFWSTNDKLSDPEDVTFLRENLNSLVVDYQVPYPYDHMDFILAFNAPKLINEPILHLFSQY